MSFPASHGLQTTRSGGDGAEAGQYVGCFAEAYGLCGLLDRACNDGGLVAVGAALIAIKAPSVDNAVVMASATGDRGKNQQAIEPAPK